MSYSDKTCTRCKITPEEFYKTHPNRQGFDFYFNYNPMDSWFIGDKDQYWCGPCHKEMQLERLFAPKKPQ